MTILTGKVHPEHLKNLTELERATVRLGVAGLTVGKLLFLGCYCLKEKKKAQMQTNSVG